MINAVDKLLLSSDQQAELAKYTREYNAAQAVGDQAGMNLAHQRAEALRASAGYSGGEAGDRYMLLTNAQDTPAGFGGYERLVQDVAQSGMNTIAAGYQKQMAELDGERAALEAQGAQNQATARSAAWNTARLAADGLLTRGLKDSGIADVITATALNQASANAYRVLLDHQQDLQENDTARLDARADALEDAAHLQSELGTLLADAYQSFYQKDADVKADIALQTLKNQAQEKKQAQDYYYTLALQELKRQWELEDRAKGR